jgi:hypothetical protein
MIAIADWSRQEAKVSKLEVRPMNISNLRKDTKMKNGHSLGDL